MASNSPRTVPRNAFVPAAPNAPTHTRILEMLTAGEQPMSWRCYDTALNAMVRRGLIRHDGKKYYLTSAGKELAEASGIFPEKKP